MNRFAVAAGMAVVAATLFAAAPGSSESNTGTLRAGSQTVTLVNEYDPEYREYLDSGVYYFKLTLSKGTPYSIWVENPDGRLDSLDVYTDFDKDYYTSFEQGETDSGTCWARLAANDWDEDDPGKVTFFVQLTGNIGDTFVINSQTGYRSFVPLGDEDNPMSLTFAEKENSFSASFVNGDFYMKSSLVKDRMYRIRTEGGTDEAPVSLSVDVDEEESEFLFYEDPKYAADTNNAALVISPDVSGRYTIVASCPSNRTFKLYYELLKARAITAHPSTPLNAANDFSATFVPGRQIATWDFADKIIDENLYSVSLAKGERMVFETSGADRALYMAVYDAKGAILSDNRTMGDGDFNVRCVLEAPSAGTYYVGVCDYYLNPYDEVVGTEVTLTARAAAALDGDPDAWDALDDTPAGATGLEVLPGKSDSYPLAAGSTHGPHRLSATDWADTFVIAARKGLTYRVGFDFADALETTTTDLKVKVFTLSGTTEKQIAAGNIQPGSDGYFEFKATASMSYYVRCENALGRGLDYPGYVVKAVAFGDAAAGDLGILTVKTFGTTAATFSLGAETVKYPGGASVLVSGRQTVKFATVKGFSVPPAQTVTVAPGTEPTVVEAYYSDTSDPKDDKPAGAVALALKNVETVQERTLWKSDPEDNFTIAGVDGNYYNLALRNVTGDAVFSITNAETGVVAEDVTSVSQLSLPKTKDKYYVVVKHADAAAPADGSYTLAGLFANVGAIKWAKTAVSAKENAASVVLTVNRTAKDGAVRVKYGTVAGTAKPGVDYVAQNGILSWDSGDSKAKTITVKLIPDLVAVHEGDKEFSVRLEPIPEDEKSASEYPAQILGGDTCTVKLQEVSKAGTTVASAYAAKAPKLATVKTEDVALSTGTFYGLLDEGDVALTNGLPRLASITLTVSAKTPADISAKVALAGKTYAFAAKGWDDTGDDAVRTRTLENVLKVNNVAYTNTLVVTLAEGRTADEGAWAAAGGTAELTMFVPDANGKGVQEEIAYSGSLFRNNAKVQEYFNAVTNFAGYYTVSLVPTGVTLDDGVPAGHGYLTLTVDNKGTAKVAGLLADGATKPSASVAACAIVPDAASANGYAMLVPVYFAKAPCCFGGTLRLYAVADEDVPDGSGRKVVVDSSEFLVWNNDNPAVTRDNADGFRIELAPCGGWYDLVCNLQAYYIRAALELSTADISEFPKESVSAGFEVSTAVEPNGTALGVAGDAFTVDKKTAVKKGSLVDLENSVNICNVAVKVARATGLVTGSCSIWSQSADGAKQKEITGIKAFGVLLFNRDAASPLDDELVAPGFLTQTVKLSDYNEATKRTTTRNWVFSAPFDVRAVDQGDTDPWADDWGVDE